MDIQIWIYVCRYVRINICMCETEVVVYSSVFFMQNSDFLINWIKFKVHILEKMVKYTTCTRNFHEIFLPSFFIPHQYIAIIIYIIFL